jgi:hypothetical protein
LSKRNDGLSMGSMKEEECERVDSKSRDISRGIIQENRQKINEFK